MSPRSLLAVAATILVVSCSVAPPPGPEPVDAAEAPDSWKRAMKRVGRAFAVIEEELGKSPAGDLRAVSDAASQSAALVRLGYGQFRDQRVPEFARMARDTESWLLRIAAEAGQGNGEIAQDLFRGGEARYCARCHDASEAVQW